MQLSQPPLGGEVPANLPRRFFCLSPALCRYPGLESPAVLMEWPHLALAARRLVDDQVDLVVLDAVDKFKPPARNFLLARALPVCHSHC